MKINLLSSKIYNRIAAGEVVERPSSVIKELVENAIDAGATKIRIDIENGGISSLMVTDNGCGIEKSELKKALLPHATSKISSLKDLDNIASLGFRGEALASIASVSKINVISKPKDQVVGAEIYAEGGEIYDIKDCAADDGTVIIVSNLFYNTPARRKFLHTERSEENDVTTTIARFILSNPYISFKYTASGKVIYNSYGDGFEAAMACIYGLESIDDCYYVETEKNGIKVTGYIGKQYYSKGNRTYQTSFINGRYVQNQTIMSAIANAYSPYLMKRQYPFYVLNITMPTEIVDANVHPNKLDVRFSNNQIVYGSIYSIISRVLDGSSSALNIVVENPTNKQETTTKNEELTIDDPSQNKENSINNKKPEKVVSYRTEKPIKRDFSAFDIVFSDSKAKGIDYNESSFENEKHNDSTVDIFAENKLFLENLAKKQKEETVAIQTSMQTDKDFKFIGQVLNTYIIFEDGTDLYFADQHAAHERILFDKLNDSLKKSDVLSQPLLLPYVLNVNNAEYEFLSSKLELLNSMGIEISEFGRNAFKVSAVPTFLTEMNLQKFFDDILSDLNSLRTFTVNDLLVEKLAQKACKAAIKSGDKLSEIEINVLLDKLKENIGLKCPHGRPVAIKITRTEIDKWFKRIV